METEFREEHKELHKRIYGCDCKPWLNERDYCEKCQGYVISFMNQFGAGVLTRDIEIENLRKTSKKLDMEIASLRKKLEHKTKRLEEIKTQFTGRKS